MDTPYFGATFAVQLLRGLSSRQSRSERCRTTPSDRKHHPGGKGSTRNAQRGQTRGAFQCAVRCSAPPRTPHEQPIGPLARPASSKRSWNAVYSARGRARSPLRCSAPAKGALMAVAASCAPCGARFHGTSRQLRVSQMALLDLTTATGTALASYTCM